MKFVVFNGSPKGKYSSTLQFVRYIENKDKESEFKYINISQDIKRIKKNPKMFDEILEKVDICDAVIWCFPVYSFMIPYQLLAFIEILYKSNCIKCFSKKYSFSIITSKNTFNNFSYNYIRNVSEDFGLKYYGTYFTQSEDLFIKDTKRKLNQFYEEIKWNITNKALLNKKFPNINKRNFEYKAPYDYKEKVKKRQFDIVLLTDCSDPNSNLYKMIELFCKAMSNEVRIIDVASLQIDGGCIGCLHCDVEGVCIYHDGFSEYWKKNILLADCIIYATDISNHWVNPIWKCIEDRLFCMGTSINEIGKVIGYIVTGDLSQEKNLQEYIETKSEINRQYLVDIITDEFQSNEDISNTIISFSERIINILEKKYTMTLSYRGIYGTKAYSDLITAIKGSSSEEVQFYKKNVEFDENKRRNSPKISVKLAVWRLMSKKSRLKILRNIKEQSLKKYDKAIFD